MATPRTFEFTERDLRKIHERAKLDRMDPEGVKQPLLDGAEYPTVWLIEDLIFRPSPNWLIDGVVEERGLTIFFGPDKVGKTAMLSSFLWAWCSGKDWFLNRDFGMRDSSRGSRKVLYVLLEGQSAFYDRYDAWREAYNEGGYLDNFFVIDEGLSLFDKNMRVDKEDEWPDSVKRLYNAIEELRPDVLVIDTWSRATPGMDENSPQTAVAIAWLDLIRDSFGLSTIIVHHVAKDKSQRRVPRGHSSLKGAASSYVCIEGEPDEAVRLLYSGPHRNAEHRIDGYPFTHVSSKFAFYVKAESGDYRKPGPLEEAIYGLVSEEGPMLLTEVARRLDKDKRNVKKSADRSDLLELFSEPGNNRVMVRVVQAEEPERF